MKFKKIFSVLYIMILLCTYSLAGHAETVEYFYNSNGNRLSSVIRGQEHRPPAISDIQDQEIAINTPKTISFTVSDDKTPADTLKLTGRSLNTEVVPDGNIIFGGSGSYRTVKITPAYNKSGMSEIIITVKDDNNLTASTSFTLTVKGGDDPVLSVSPDSRDADETSGTTVFTVKNAGTGTMNWTANADVPWITIEKGKSGTDEGEIMISYEPHSGDQRIGTITVTSPDAENSPQTVKLIQPKRPVLSITHSAQNFGAQTFFTTQVKIKNVRNLGSFELEIRFDPSFVCAQGVESGNFIGSTGRNILEVDNITDCNAGIIKYAVTTLGPTPPGPDGSGVLVTINWQSLRSGNTSDIILQKRIKATYPNANEIMINDEEEPLSPCYPHDLDADGDVDIVDVTKIAYHYGCRIEDDCYDPAYDFDNDVDIDIVDITAVAYDYGCPFDSGRNSRNLLSSRSTHYRGPSSVKVVWADKTVELGQTFTTDIMIYGVEDLGSFGFELKFNPSVIESKETRLGDFLGSTDRSVFEVKNEIDNENGVIKYAFSTLGRTPPGPSGDGFLAAIIWHSKAIGECGLDLTDIKVTHPDASLVDVITDSSVITVRIGGDIDNNSIVDLNDALLVLKVMAGNKPENINLNADINDNEKIGLEEVVYILQKVSHIEQDTVNRKIERR
ncbi:MAG: hypothetical protein GY749_17935 [Desulfobacteraceae bacterium]|nr:hypothetical protein [Desulfobacteraceae bacterium]